MTDDFDFRFESIEREAKFIIVGRSPDLEKPVRIPDKNWAEIEDFEGNWEQVTKAAVQEHFQENLQVEGDSRMELPPDVLAKTIESNEIVPKTEFDEKPLRGRLLVEHLVRENVYDVQDSTVVVVDFNITPESIHLRSYNLSAFFNAASEILEKTTTRATELQEEIKSYSTNQETAETEEKPSFDDIDAIIHEQAKLARSLKELENQIDISKDKSINIAKQLGVHIDEMETYNERFRHLEQQVRQKSMYGVVDTDEYPELLSLVGTVASEVGVISDTPVDALDEEQLSNKITDTMDEEGYDLGESVGDDSSNSEDSSAGDSPGGFEEIAGTLEQDEDDSDDQE